MFTTLLTHIGRSAIFEYLTTSLNFHHREMRLANKHPIKVVARRTGLSPHVIRIWEKRYEAVVPERTETNRRLYSDADIERLLLLRRALAAGRSIGQVAQLPDEQLLEMVNGDEANITHAPESLGAHVAVVESYATIRQNCLAAITNLDAAVLESLLNQALVDLSQPQLINQLLLPLLEELGARWQDGTLRIAHEHLASTVIRSFLSHLFGSMITKHHAPALIATTLSGQLHELGAMIAAIIAQSAGWHATYLGPNLPAEEIAVAAKHNRAKAIALSLVYPTDDPNVALEIRRLRRLLPPSVEILTGGRAAGHYAEVLTEIGAHFINKMEELGKKLELLRQ